MQADGMDAKSIVKHTLPHPTEGHERLRGLEITGDLRLHDAGVRRIGINATSRWFDSCARSFARKKETQYLK